MACVNVVCALILPKLSQLFGMKAVYFVVNIATGTALILCYWVTDKWGTLAPFSISDSLAFRGRFFDSYLWYLLGSNCYLPLCHIM